MKVMACKIVAMSGVKYLISLFGRFFNVVVLVFL